MNIQGSSWTCEVLWGVWGIHVWSVRCTCVRCEVYTCKVYTCEVWGVHVWGVRCTRVRCKVYTCMVCEVWPCSTCPLLLVSALNRNGNSNSRDKYEMDLLHRPVLYSVQTKQQKLKGSRNLSGKSFWLCSLPFLLPEKIWRTQNELLWNLFVRVSDGNPLSLLGVLKDL